WCRRETVDAGVLDPCDRAGRLPLAPTGDGGRERMGRKRSAAAESYRLTESMADSATASAPLPPRLLLLSSKIERLIAWLQAKLANATHEDGAGDAAMVIRVMQRERERLAHEARRQAMRRNDEA